MLYFVIRAKHRRLGLPILVNCFNLIALKGLSWVWYLQKLGLRLPEVTGNLLEGLVFTYFYFAEIAFKIFLWMSHTRTEWAEYVIGL